MYSTKLYRIAAVASAVKSHAAVIATGSRPKLSSVAAIEPRMIENSSQERNVRSVAK